MPSRIASQASGGLPRIVNGKPRFQGWRHNGGVLELIVHGLTVVFENEESRVVAFEDLCRASVLSRGNASCLLRGTEQSAPEFSRASLQELCSKLPYILYQEVPDAHSANGRKKAKTFAALPDNAMGVNALCLAHQGHRIVASR